MKTNKEVSDKMTQLKNNIIATIKSSRDIDVINVTDEMIMDELAFELVILKDYILVDLFEWCYNNSNAYTHSELINILDRFDALTTYEN